MTLNHMPLGSHKGCKMFESKIVVMSSDRCYIARVNIIVSEKRDIQKQSLVQECTVFRCRLLSTVEMTRAETGRLRDSPTCSGRLDPSTKKQALV
jgi:hypothetical protein